MYMESGVSLAWQQLAGDYKSSLASRAAWAISGYVGHMMARYSGQW